MKQLQQVVIRSPVQDGEFRALHKVTLDSPQNAYEKGFDLSGNEMPIYKAGIRYNFEKQTSSRRFFNA